MGKMILKDGILDKIKADAYLLADVATCLDYTTAYTLRLIREKDERLTQASVIRILKTKLRLKKDSDLLTETHAVAV